MRGGAGEVVELSCGVGVEWGVGKGGGGGDRSARGEGEEGWAGKEEGR